jgi:hypothetical protein
MRKLFGFAIALVAVLFLGMAYSRIARAETPSCASALAAKIVNLKKEDQAGILGLQFEVTKFKIASETLKFKSKTSESYIKQQEDLIAKLDDKDIRGKMRKIYQDEGENPDLDKIDTAMDEASARAKAADYHRDVTTGEEKDMRFRNKDLSAFVLASTLSDPEKSIYSLNDASVLYYYGEISDGIEAAKGRGSYEGNMAEASTQIARVAGYDGSDGKTYGLTYKQTMDQWSAAGAALGDDLEKIAVTYADELKKSCSEMSTCATCAISADKNRITDAHMQEALQIAMAAIVKGMQTSPEDLKLRTDAMTAAIVAEKMKPKLDDGKEKKEKKVVTAAKTTKKVSTTAKSSSGVQVITLKEVKITATGPNKDGVLRKKDGVEIKGVFFGNPHINDTPYPISVVKTKYNGCAGNLVYHHHSADSDKHTGESYSVTVTFTDKSNPKTVHCNQDVDIGPKLTWAAWSDDKVAHACGGSDFKKACTPLIKTK